MNRFIKAAIIYLVTPFCLGIYQPVVFFETVYCVKFCTECWKRLSSTGVRLKEMCSLRLSMSCSCKSAVSFGLLFICRVFIEDLFWFFFVLF